MTLYKVSCILLAQANQNAALLVRERLHNTAVESHHSHAITDLVQPRNGSSVTRPFPTGDWGLVTRLIKNVRLLNYLTSDTSSVDSLSGTGSMDAHTLADDGWLRAELDCFFLAIILPPGTPPMDLVLALYRTLCSKSPSANKADIIP